MRCSASISSIGDIDVNPFRGEAAAGWVDARNQCHAHGHVCMRQNAVNVASLISVLRADFDRDHSQDM